ncbi:hypothetical protein A1D29_03345 [Pasteurellaceae bacterium Orientalotternb1]|nr:hypothetical protein A1D29_03345 [Pasteurellaceae bacterium Orientalotternb1]
MTFLQFIGVVDHHKPLPKLFVGFDVVGVGDDAVVDRADFLAGWHIIMPYAFGAKSGIDHIDLIPHRDRLIRTLGFAHIAVGTFVSNQ